MVKKKEVAFITYDLGLSTVLLKVMGGIQICLRGGDIADFSYSINHIN